MGELLNQGYEKIKKKSKGWKTQIQINDPKHPNKL